MVPRWRFLATILRPVFAASRVQQVSDLHLKFALRPHHVCGRPLYFHPVVSSSFFFFPCVISTVAEWMYAILCTHRVALVSSTCPHNMAIFGPLAAEIDPVVCTPANFNGFRILAALLHSI